MAGTRIIGIGNPDRGDDGAGHAVIKLLSSRNRIGAEILAVSGEASELLALFDEADAVWLIDACMSGARPGSILRFDLVRERLPETISGLSTHGFGLNEAIRLARTFGTLPKSCILHVIEGADFEAGSGISPLVSKALENVVLSIETEIGNRDS